jgi:hypothetical protein
MNRCCEAEIVCNSNVLVINKAAGSGKKERRSRTTKNEDWTYVQVMGEAVYWPVHKKDLPGDDLPVSSFFRRRLRTGPV